MKKIFVASLLSIVTLASVGAKAASDCPINDLDKQLLSDGKSEIRVKVAKIERYPIYHFGMEVGSQGKVFRSIEVWDTKNNKKIATLNNEKTYQTTCALSNVMIAGRYVVQTDMLIEPEASKRNKKLAEGTHEGRGVSIYDIETKRQVYLPVAGPREFSVFGDITLFHVAGTKIIFLGPVLHHWNYERKFVVVDMASGLVKSLKHAYHSNVGYGWHQNSYITPDAIYFEGVGGTSGTELVRYGFNDSDSKVVAPLNMTNYQYQVQKMEMIGNGNLLFIQAHGEILTQGRTYDLMNFNLSSGEVTLLKAKVTPPIAQYGFKPLSEMTK